MAVLRKYADVLAFDGGPTKAEKKLIEACKAGEACILGLDCPDKPDTARTIRADVLRYLIVGGCADVPVASAGVFVSGAYVSGPLNLDFAIAHGATRFANCQFSHVVSSELAMLQNVAFANCTLPGWIAQGAQVKGNIFLDKTTTTETLDLSGTIIGGQLVCAQSTLGSTEDTALNAHSIHVKGGVFLNDTTTTASINLSGAKIDGQLSCTGATLSPEDGFALLAQHTDVKGGVFLNDTKANATLDLNGSTIGGPLVCLGAVFHASVNSYALIASAARIEGGVFLHPRVQAEKDEVETPFHCTGELRFNGATLGGLYAQSTTLVATSSGQSLSLGGATVNGAVRLDGCKSTGEILLAGSRISGRLTCERITLRNDTGHAFNGQAMRVEHSFVWKKVTHHSGGVSLNGAHVAELDDHPDNWPSTTHLFLDGFTYDRIKGTVSTSPARMDWLKSGSYFGTEFRPQPYSQYAKFLRETGHDEDARRVMFKREQQRRASLRAERAASGRLLSRLANAWFVFWDFMLRVVVGYGHYPFNSVAALATLIICTIIPAHYAWEEGSFAPNAAPVLVSDTWTDIARTESQPAAVWSGDTLPGASELALADWKAQAPGRDWETFNRYAYGFDVVIPIIDFGQTDAWAPSTNRGPWGWHLWWARWVLSVMGWIVTALGAAAITGIIRRE